MHTCIVCAIHIAGYFGVKLQWDNKIIHIERIFSPICTWYSVTFFSPLLWPALMIGWKFLVERWLLSKTSTVQIALSWHSNSCHSNLKAQNVQWFLPQGKAFQNRPHGYSVTTHSCYSAVVTHPTGLLSCIIVISC